MATKLTIVQGSTFQQVLRWESPTFVYKQITGITQAAPAVITATGHGVPDGWRVAIVSVKGMTEINALNNPPKESEYRKATLLDANSIELNSVNAAEFTPYASGGYVQYRVPVDLSGYSARMDIRDKIGGTLLQELDSSTGEILLDNTLKTITLFLEAAVTEAITWKKGVFDLEMLGPAGLVVPLVSGTVAVTREVTITT